MEQIAIYGSGGFAREVAWLIQSCNLNGVDRYKIVCFIDDDVNKQGLLLNEIPVFSLEGALERFPTALVTGAIGMPSTREIVIRKAEQIGYKFTTIIHPNVELSKWNEIGNGVVICAGNILTVNIRLGQHVQINLDCTIGHDAILDDFTTLAPGVHVSGYVHMGKRVYVGTGATIINGTHDNPLIIGDDVIIGAGACVTRSIPARTTVVGVPAKPISRS